MHMTWHSATHRQVFSDKAYDEDDLYCCVHNVPAIERAIQYGDSALPIFFRPNGVHLYVDDT